MDRVAERYGTLPSEMLGLERGSSRAFMMDLTLGITRMTEDGKERGDVAESTADKIRRKRRNWDL